MIDLAHGQATRASALRCGRALIERFTPEPVETPATDVAQEWVEIVTSHLTATNACAVVEHLFGVLPLVDFFESADGAMATIAAGSKLAALGLFTPTPELGWGGSAMAAERSGGALRVCGEVRLPSYTADGSIVLVRVSGDTDLRLAWLEHDTHGVERRASRTGGPRRDSHSPCWLAVDGATIGLACVSRPVTLAPGTELYRRLEVYASIWALVAVNCARRAVQALRRAARTTRCHGRLETFSASQLIAMGITEVEIATELTAAAARRHFTRVADAPRASGLILALSAARTLAAVTAKANELHDRLGVALDGSLADDGVAATLTAYLGGTLMLENELARALGLGHSFAQ